MKSGFPTELAFGFNSLIQVCGEGHPDHIANHRGGAPMADQVFSQNWREIQKAVTQGPYSTSEGREYIDKLNESKGPLYRYTGISRLCPSMRDGRKRSGLLTDSQCPPPIFSQA